MTFREVVLSITGLRERDLMFHGIARRMTAIIASTNFGGKGVAGKMNKLWPMPGDDRPKVSSRALETLRKFREADAVTRAKQKLDARRS